ncbi:chondroitin sulfate synthase 1 [Periplaneta americana]|uniref:chondroitin sulfate synthase 1 n=1 Tax=Periplaneta americana TaxID=6978 RepID=UPI0037E89259
MVAYGEEHLCHPTTELVTFTPSRRRLPAFRRPLGVPTTMLSAARRRRGFHATLGVLIGLAAGFLVTSRLGIGLVTALWDGSANGTCSGTGGSWPLPANPADRKAGLRDRDEDDPLRIIGMTVSGETVHNSRKTLLFVGVMTAHKYLATRARAVYETWGREIPGRIAFFTSATSVPPSNRPDLPLVRLKGVDDSYPPQKKSFLMLQYMWERYGDRFEWFLRADDDVYVRPDRLERLLRSVDSRKPQFIGQAGRGNQEEFGLLSLEYDENFCMGGPGVLLSRETLARVAPHVKTCLRNLYTTHEDVELGRCVQKFAGIPCTWSYEMQTILYHNSSGREAFTGSLKQKEVHRAITLHPVKQHRHMYRIHNYMKSLKIQELQQQALTLHRDVASMMALLGHRPEAAEQFMLGNGVPLFPAKMGSRGYLGDTAMLGIEPGLNKFTPHSEVEVLTWDFISRSLYSASSTNPRRRIDSPLKEGLEDVVREVMDMINMYSKQRGRVIEYREILYGYHRLNPQYGADYILDLLLVYKKYRGRKMTVPVRRHVYLQQQFTGLEIQETIDGEEVVIKSREEDEEDSVLEDQLESHQVQSPFRDAFENGLLKIGEVFPGMLSPSEPKDSASKIRNKIINFILPLSGRFEIFQRFLSVYEDVCLQDDQKTTLTVVLYPSFTDPPSFNNSLSLLQRFQLKYPLSRIDVISASGSFARAEALELGASRFDDKVDNLLFFVDVDMVFNTKTLERIRLNTIKGKQAYFPIVFSEFDPSFSIHRTGALRNHFVVSRDTGYWRQFGFGIVSVYRSDMKLIGGYDTGIRGWGKEDVDLFDKFVTVAANFTVFRSADPQLVHVFHIVDCDPKLDDVQLSMCKGSRADTYGSVTQLAQYIYNRKDQIFQFAKYRKHQEPPS